MPGHHVACDPETLKRLEGRATQHAGPRLYRGRLARRRPRHEDLDATRLEQRAVPEGVADALAELRRIISELERGDATKAGSSPRSPGGRTRPARFGAMPKRERDLELQIRGRERTAARRQRLAAGFATPYRRDSLRSESEARFLRRIGTPEELIGPVGPDDDVAAERAALLEFARQRRVSAGTRP